MKSRFVYAVLSGALFLSSTNAWSQAQRAMTIGELFSLVETGSNSLQVKPKSVIRISLCRKAARNPLFCPIAVR